MWYGSSASTPGRAFRAVLDACRLAEEDAFAYKNLRSGRFVLDPDARRRARTCGGLCETRTRRA